MPKPILAIVCLMFATSCGGNAVLGSAAGARRESAGFEAGARWSIRYSKGVTYAGAVLGPDGDIWMCDGGFGTTLDHFLPGGGVRKYELGYHPEQLTIGSDGAFWLTTNGSTILRVTKALKITAYAVTDFLAGGIVTGGDGNVWFVEQFHIGRISPRGELKEYPLTTGSQSFEAIGETGIAWGPDEHLWFGVFSHGYFIVSLDPASGALRIVGSDNSTGGPVVAGADGNIWYPDGWTRSSYQMHLTKLTVSGQATSYVGPDGFLQPGTPQGMIVGPDRALWIVTQHIVGGRVVGGGLLRFDTQKNRSSAYAPPKGYEWEWALAFDRAGNTWMSGNNQAQIFKK